MPGGVNRSMFELGHTSTYKKIQTTLVTYKNITKVWWILYGFRQYITKSSKGKIIIIKTKSCKKEQKKKTSCIFNIPSMQYNVKIRFIPWTGTCWILVLRLTGTTKNSDKNIAKFWQILYDFRQGITILIFNHQQNTK